MDGLEVIRQVPELQPMKNQYKYIAVLPTMANVAISKYLAIGFIENVFSKEPYQIGACIFLLVHCFHPIYEK